jgi:uncharacterized RDD family membrane protein YckC
VDQPLAPRGVQPRAAFGQRFVAYVIDVVLLNIVGVLFLRGSGVQRFAVGAAVFIAYFVLCEGTRAGQTVGKRVAGIRVVDFEAGTPIDPARAFVRTLGRFASGLLLFLGYFWMLWDRDRQTWHDKIASTTVVPADDFPVERR